MYNEMQGDLIELAKLGTFDVIVHGCNCFCSMETDLSIKMQENFSCNLFKCEHDNYKGNINKLGNIDYEKFYIYKGGAYLSEYFPKEKRTIEHTLTVVNAYTMYKQEGHKPLSYSALIICLRKINQIFKGLTIGLPKIGSDSGGGDWGKIKKIIKEELFDCKVIIVNYDEN